MMVSSLLATCLISLVQQAIPSVLPLRERAEIMDGWLANRLASVAPRILREQGIDMWILAAREYCEDPVLETMLPATWFAARRLTVLVFFDPTPQGHEGAPLPLERLSVSRYDIGRFFPSAWNPEEEPDPWKRVGKIVEERKPRRIAVNVDEVFGLGDGLSSTLHRKLLAALTPRDREVVTADHDLPVRWLETRIPEEMELYPAICRISHQILAGGLSDRAVDPGKTTTADLEWWFRERIAELRLETWFHPTVSVQRRREEHSGSFARRGASQTIERGDLVHVDFGITYLGLNTDMQQHAYVLGAGEERAPEGLRKGLAVGNRLQDILMDEFEAGRIGNQILKAARERAQAEGIAPTIYTHPLGFHGHAAGPTIGLWDQQGGVSGTGDYPLHADTAYSIELAATVAVPEWDGEEVRIMLEEDAFFDGKACRFIDGRQTEFFLIR